MSNVTEFVEAVAAMRATQKKYFRDRQNADYAASRRLEAAVDRMLVTIRGDGYTSAHPLFDREDDRHA